ncbi:alpha/beta hydrolase [Streptomyces albus]|uniref:Alpha/beta hydrolase n=1 Tax=Streptomyces albus (strain ATCC 21838 / DSM 41398 / FERM P-419 / JCM 4703 / NBRC 107858) TaxID=1081613 RepID=A0A0B5EZU6_STRA4|nr:alpha/beta hydrolase [Streptomyces albus]AOU79166.1 alpha/beta hydrolase [Streptomyces albus]AYN34899.1 alpha/beta hydrolase [Streptomyces albus]
MARAEANGIEIEYETFGAPGDPALLLVAGLGQQLLAYPAEFCRMLAGAGFHVVRYDNRDSGLSSGTPEDVPPPDWQAIVSNDYSSASYTVPDLAKDAAALLTALGIGSAHLVGVSMGGMIVQQLAILRPDLVRSLTSVMSTTGERAVGRPSPEASAILFAPQQRTRQAALTQMVRSLQVLASPEYPTPEEELYAYVAAAHDRAHRPLGTARQLAAVMCSPDRTAELARLDVPALVVHGSDDCLIDPSGGRATAAAIPGARLLTVPGMGHDLPRQLWRRLADEIIRLAGEAEAAARGAEAAPAARGAEPTDGVRA